MTLDNFRQSLDSDTPPDNVSAPLMALWYAAKNNWKKAHDYAQRNNDSESAWVHAYLHRQEGDTVNANYWYTRAGRTMPEERLEEEWDNIVQTLLKEAK